MYEGKNIENRNWLPNQDVFGQTIALHASKRMDEEAFGFLGLMDFIDPETQDEQFPTGAILATAVLEGYVTESESEWFFGKYGWLLSNVQILREPIFCKGKLGLWNIIPPHEKSIREQTSS